MEIAIIPNDVWIFLTSMESRCSNINWRLHKTRNQLCLNVTWPVNSLCVLPVGDNRGSPERPSNSRQKTDHRPTPTVGKVIVVKKRKSPSQKKRDRARLVAWKEKLTRGRPTKCVAADAPQPPCTKTDTPDTPVSVDTPSESVNCVGLTVRESNVTQIEPTETDAAEPSAVKPRMCYVCHHPESDSGTMIRLCMGCNSVGYCKQACQLKHWI